MSSTHRSDRNVLFSCDYHIVWCPKHRRSVLADVDPQYGVHRLIKEVKGTSSREVRAGLAQVAIGKAMRRG